MIAEIKKKYIAAVMLSVIAVLGIIVAFINTVNYFYTNERSEIRLDFIARTDNLFPETEQLPGEDGEVTEDEEENDIIDEETPFDTRYFTVTFRNDGAIIGTDIQRVKRVTNEQAIVYAAAVFQEESQAGYYEDYKYRAIHHEEKVIYIFLDASRELASFRSFLTSSIIISAIGAVIIFAFLIILANFIFKPIIESYEKQKRFITDAGHELKTPLAIIEANAEVIEMENGGSEWIESIKKQTGRLAKLTESLVTLSRMEEAVGSSTHSIFSLSDTVSEIAESWRIVAESKGRSLIHYTEPEILMKGSKNDIAQLVSILLDNAVKYSSDTGDITLNLEKTAAGAALTLSNQVDEIEIGSQNVLFNRFYRRDSSRNSGKGGFGIGLSMAKSIVQNHKGKISAYSEDGTSLTFSIQLPLPTISAHNTQGKTI